MIMIFYPTVFTNMISLAYWLSSLSHIIIDPISISVEQNSHGTHGPWIMESILPPDQHISYPF